MNHTLEMAYNLSDTLIISYSQHYTFRPHYSNYRAAHASALVSSGLWLRNRIRPAPGVKVAMWFFYICNSLEFVTYNLFIYLFIYLFFII